MDKRRSRSASSRSRGRPSKTESKPKKREPSRSRSRPRGRPPTKDSKPKEVKRSRSRSRSSSKTRPPSRSRPAPTPKKKEEPTQEVKIRSSSVIVNDIADRKNLNEVIRRSLSREVTSEKARGADNLIRRSTRVAAKETTTSKKIESWVKEPKVSAKSSKKIEFGGWIGSVGHIIVFGAAFTAILLGCTKEQCLLKPFHIPRNWRVYLNGESALAVMGFLVAQTLLSLLPIGRLVRTPNGSSSYRANGFLALILSGAAVAGAWYYGCPVTLTYERWISIAVSAYITAWFLSFVLFIKGGRASISGLNPYGNTGNKVYDFYTGRELNPMLFKRINLKVVLLRSCVIAVIILDGLLVLKGYEVRKELSPTLLTAVSLWAIYCLDHLWFEETFSSTFESQYEGLGFMSCQAFLLYPFMRGIIPRFILTHRVELPAYALAGIVVAFLIGYFIFRASNLQKATFRKNPLDPNVAHLETIPTNRGKKLLVSGWWGIVKHPNYLGDIIAHWAMTAPTGITHAFPYSIPIFYTIFFLYRAIRDDRRCRERYQGAWEEYSRRVPYFIIPRVY